MIYDYDHMVLIGVHFYTSVNMTMGRPPGSVRALERDKRIVLKILKKGPGRWTEIMQRLEWPRDQDMKRLSRALKALENERLIRKDQSSAGRWGQWHITSQGVERDLIQDLTVSISTPAIPKQRLMELTFTKAYEDDLKYLISSGMGLLYHSFSTDETRMDTEVMKTTGKISLNLVLSKALSEKIREMSRLYEGERVLAVLLQDLYYSIIQGSIEILYERHKDREFIDGRVFEIRTLLRYDRRTKRIGRPQIKKKTVS